jgi:transcriptional regulator with XRE-family HTH domain
MNKQLAAYLSKRKESDSYWVEKTKMDFAFTLEKRRKSLSLSYSALAEKLGTSGAYITKIFRGDANLTIESMAKLAKATGGYLDVKIVDNQVRNQPILWMTTFNNRKAVNVTSTAESNVSTSNPNDLEYALGKRAA